MTGCAHHDDGRHRWRFVGPSAWSAEPHYGCGLSCGIVLVTGDGIAEDVAYLAELGGVMVISCARCDREGEIGGTIVVLDLGGDTTVCRSCAAIPEGALRLDLAEIHGVRCEGCGDQCEDDEVDRYVTPVGTLDLCHTCGPDDADTRADLAAMRAEVPA